MQSSLPSRFRTLSSVCCIKPWAQDAPSPSTKLRLLTCKECIAYLERRDMDAPENLAFPYTSRHPAKSCVHQVQKPESVFGFRVQGSGFRV
jgi:hypothetical protein